MATIQQTSRVLALKSYQKQLDVARRLTQAKVRSKIRDAMLSGDMELRERLVSALEPVDPDPGHTRGAFVKSAAEALFMSLVFTGNSNPITESIRKELSRVLDKEVEFTYPPGGKMRLVVSDANGARSLTEEEQRLVTPVLRQITSQEVDNSMLGKSGKKLNSISQG